MNNHVHIQEISDTTNTSWVLGDVKFQKEIEDKIVRRGSPCLRADDHKSKGYEKTKL